MFWIRIGEPKCRRQRDTRVCPDWHFRFYQLLQNRYGSAWRTLDGAVGSVVRMAYPLLGKIYDALDYFRKLVWPAGSVPLGRAQRLSLHSRL